MEEHFIGSYFLDLPHSRSERMFVKYAKTKKLGDSVMVVVGKGYSHSHLKNPDRLKSEWNITEFKVKKYILMDLVTLHTS